MAQQLDTPGLDKAEKVAIAAALDGLRTQGAACQAYARIGSRNLWVNAVDAPLEAWPAAAAKRAAAQGRWLLPVVDVGGLDDRLWIAYDMGSTTPLSYSREHRRMAAASCLRLLSDIARGLDDATTAGVFASEVPPESVFVSRRGAWLGDLGTAREALGGSGSGLGADTGYVPPEVLQGGSAGERSAVYVFGALMYHLLAGESPRRARLVPLSRQRPDLPATLDWVVATAMAGEPQRRPHSAAEAHKLVERWIGKPDPASDADVPAPASVEDESPTEDAMIGWSEIAPQLLDPGRPKPPRGRPERSGAKAAKPAPAEPAEPAPAKSARRAKRSRARAPKPASATPAKPSRAKPWDPKPSGARAAKPSPAKAAKPSRAKAAQPAKPSGAKGAKPSAAMVAKPSPATVAKPAPHRPEGTPTKPGPTKRAPAKPKPVPSRRRRKPSLSGTPSQRRFLAAAVAGSLLLGAIAGLLLGQSSEPEPARADVVNAGGVALAVPPGWHAVDTAGADAVTLRTNADSGASLRARLVDEPLEREPGAEPVRLGTLQAWRSAAPGVVRYAAPTTDGTVLITCRTSPAAGAGPLEQCERTASTLRLRTASALPLAGMIEEEEERLRAAVTALSARRDGARQRLAGADGPSEQRAAARALARSHERAAAVIDGMSGAQPIEAAIREAAAAYASLAASAESGSSGRWSSAVERVRSKDAALAEVLNARG